MDFLDTFFFQMASETEDRSFASVVTNKETRMLKALKSKLTWISKQNIRDSNVFIESKNGQVKILRY